jgi:hypothetical protein
MAQVEEHLASKPRTVSSNTNIKKGRKKKKRQRESEYGKQPHNKY